MAEEKNKFILGSIRKEEEDEKVEN